MTHETPSQDLGEVLQNLTTQAEEPQDSATPRVLIFNDINFDNISFHEGDKIEGIPDIRSYLNLLAKLAQQMAKSEDTDKDHTSWRDLNLDGDPSFLREHTSDYSWGNYRIDETVKSALAKSDKTKRFHGKYKDFEIVFVEILEKGHRVKPLYYTKPLSILQGVQLLSTSDMYSTGRGNVGKVGMLTTLCISNDNPYPKSVGIDDEYASREFRTIIRVDKVSGLNFQGVTDLSSETYMREMGIAMLHPMYAGLPSLGKRR